MAAERDRTPVVTITGHPSGGGTLSLKLEQDASGRRRPEGSSLLFDDLPVPHGVDVLSMERDLAEGWDFRERYAPVVAIEDLSAWYLTAMADRGWVFERLEPRAGDAAQVYHADGEEILIGFVDGAGASTEIVLSRRRVCESGAPVAVAPEGPEARRLLEVPVYPGSEFVGFSLPEESYEVTCASLDGVTDWYRAAMEAGDWRLAAIEGPSEPLQRRLLFVRPSEVGLPPEERTAWAQVDLERLWPYLYAIRLRRDPGGIKPAQ
jgi:hypothetical protein